MQPSILVMATVATLAWGGAVAKDVGDVDWVDAVLAGEAPVPSADAARGVSVLMQAAEAGHGQAQYGLGMLYLAGKIVTQDDAAAARWLTRAADAGIGAAESNLGFLYLQGRGVARDPRMAAQLLQRAAAKNIAAAQHNLGWMAQMGEGTPKEMGTAIRWYSAAAQAGYSQSQYNLGVLLASGAGDGTGPDPVGAVKWLSLAGLSPHPDVHQRATEKLVELSRAVPPPVVAAGLEEARRWLATGRVY